jgi:alpha-glucosidase
MPIARFCPLLIACVAAACSSSHADSPVAPAFDAGADATDASLETDSPDEHDDSSNTTDADADAPGEGSDDGPNLPAHCAAPTALPAWAEQHAGDFQLVAHTAEMDLYLAAIDDGVVRLHPVGKGDSPSPRSWALQKPPVLDAQAIVTGTAEGAQICTAWMRLDVTASGTVHVTDTKGRVLLDDGSAGGWKKTSAADGGAGFEVRVRRATPPAEHFYGFGERTGPLDKRGQAMVFWNTDSYDPSFGGWPPDQDPLYQSIPFFVGLNDGAAYGLLTDNAHRLEMDMAKADPSVYEIKAFGGTLDQYLVAGPQPAEVLRRYSALTGRIRMPPKWSLGYHQSRWGYSPASKLLDLAGQFRSRKIPADALWLDIQHMDGFRTFTWDPTAFADPAALSASLAADGFRLVAIADPGIKVDSVWDVYTSGLASGVFLQKPGGGPFVGKVWPGDSVFPDFTLPAARTWWGALVGSEVQRGLRGVWLDVNEPTLFPESGGGVTVPGDLPVAGDGAPTTMAEAHNVYALHQARATWDGMRAAAPDQRPFILSRAGYASIQRWAAVWTGDAPSTFSSLQGTLPMLLGMGLSGLPFVGSDVGGYSGGASPELFARWMALGSISPFFRGHVTSGVNDQEPWQFGTEVEDISRILIRQRYEYLPYLYSVFADAAETGAPVLRPLLYHYPNDPSVLNLGDEAMLGPYVLVAPVLSQGAATRSIYLPAGRWFELHSGAIWDGPVTLQHAVRLAALPMYVRQGAVLPRTQPMQYTSEQDAGPLFMDVWPAAQPETFVFYEDAGDGFSHETSEGYSRVAWQASLTPPGARVVVGPRQGTFLPPPRTLLIRVHRVDQTPSQVTAASVLLQKATDYDALLAAGEGWWWDERDLSIVIAHPDQDNIEFEITGDMAIQELRPPVSVELEVQVPAGTPVSPQIHVASSASGWVHQPLAWTSTPGVASGFVSVPRGEWFEYKYTRGDWATVEKWPGCQEATNRYGFGSAYPLRQETVYGWADWCP